MPGGRRSTVGVEQSRELKWKFLTEVKLMKSGQAVVSVAVVLDIFSELSQSQGVCACSSERSKAINHIFLMHCRADLVAAQHNMTTSCWQLLNID